MSNASVKCRKARSVTVTYQLEGVTRIKSHLSIEPANGPAARPGPRVREPDARARSGTIR